MVPEMLEMLDLTNIGSIRYLETKQFTFRQKTPLVHSRLDYFLMAYGVEEIVLWMVYLVFGLTTLASV